MALIGARGGCGVVVKGRTRPVEDGWWLPAGRRARAGASVGEDDHMERLRHGLMPARGNGWLRWPLAAALPGWLRRVWGQSVHPAPRLSPSERARLRRIAYL